MAIPETVGIVEAFGSILKIFQVIKESDQSVAMKAQLTELYSAIVAGQQSALQSTIQQQALLEEKNQLKEELAKIKAWEEQKKRYKLINPWTGNPALVYALKESCKGTEEPHWICTKCYDDGRRTILQPREEDRGIILFCHTCKTQVHSGMFGIAPAKYAQD